MRLSAILQIPSNPDPADPEAALPVVVLKSRESTIAFLVDRVRQEQEMMMKPLGPQLVRVRHVTGATVLGGGRLAPVLNVGDLFTSASQTAGGSMLAPPAPPTPRPKLSILVAEDSITSRTLLKSILRAAGYEVQVAVDGLDALTQLTGNPLTGWSRMWICRG